MSLAAAGRQNGFVVTSSCTLQPWQTTAVLLTVFQACVQTLSILQLELLLNETNKNGIFLLGFAHLK